MPLNRQSILLTALMLADRQAGAPADLAIEQAMARRTCRFMERRMDDNCRPELA